MKCMICRICLLLLVISCDKPTQLNSKNNDSQPVTEDAGRKILFSERSPMLTYFEYGTVDYDSIRSRLVTPAVVAVTISASRSGERSIVLFNDPELESVYSQFLQHITNINTYKINRDRLADLVQHGAATGKELLEAETVLSNEAASLTEEEGKLKIAGLNPDQLRNPASGQAWLLCEVPEIQIRNIHVGDSCFINFTAYPDQIFSATVGGVSSEVDVVTRMNRVRVQLLNESGKFKVGMFAQVNFQSEINYSMVIPVSAVVNVQGKDYAFVKNSKNTFERREILTGFQSEDKITVLKGLMPHEVIVSKGAIALKGISFGY